MALEHESLTGNIIAAAIEVHRRLGPGFVEAVYENAFVLELKKRGFNIEQQKEIQINYDGIKIGQHRLDLLVEDIIVVELKAVRSLEDIHYAIVKSYLRATGKEHGLLLNFSKPTLEVKRVINPINKK
ncbi:MAG: GxxExxY protein [Anaerolineales bacterium]|nr:GxxExxY protein [Anaerolineales bacterium]